MPFLYLFNVAVSWGLLSLIWLVQIIIYPGLARIDPGDFVDYHRWYVARITAIVTPLMICEAGVTIAWLWFASVSTYSLASALLVIVVWISTFSLQVPMHKRLQSGKHDARIERLVATNWIRTVAWSLKAIVTAAAAYYTGA